jgi:UTP--glucose-1-phosphate uridylyltransferase
MKVEKAIFPIAGLATRFLPLSKVISKELLPLVDKPLVNYTVEEACRSGVKEIQFVVRKNQKDVLDYFKSDEELEKRLIEKDRRQELEELRKIEHMIKEVSFSSVIQKSAKGDADAIYESRDFAGKDAVGVFFCDDIIRSKGDPGFQQLKEVFETCQSPVLGLKKLPGDKLSSYGVVNVEKIANGFYKIKGVSQRPKDNPPSDLAIMGRMILTPDVFEYMEKHKELREKDISVDVRVLPSKNMRIRKIQALPYPGFPPDLLSVVGVLATQTKGTTLIHDPLYEGRLKYMDGLTKMGADIFFSDPHRALINGVKKLYGTDVGSFDLRGGASLIIAGLIAEGQTIIRDIYQVDRGYERIEERLKKLGADIERIK